MKIALLSSAHHTRFVHLVRRALYVLAACLAGLLLYYSFAKTAAGGIRILFTGMERTATQLARLKSAHYHGLDEHDQPYDIVARQASQRDEDTVDLVEPKGDIILNQGRWLSITSNNGVFHMKTHDLDLNGSVQMFDDEGYEFRTDHLQVALPTKQARTKDIVKGQGPLGHLTSKGAFIDGNAHILTFYGRVYVTIYPNAQVPGSPQAL
jgi:lipopolysaccharide export system protein LptC